MVKRGRPEASQLVEEEQARPRKRCARVYACERKSDCRGGGRWAAGIVAVYGGGWLTLIVGIVCSQEGQQRRRSREK